MLSITYDQFPEARKTTSGADQSQPAHSEVATSTPPLLQRHRAPHAREATIMQGACSSSSTSTCAKPRAARALILAPFAHGMPDSPPSTPDRGSSMTQSEARQATGSNEEQQAPQQDVMDRAASFSFPDSFSRESTSSPTPLPTSLRPSSSPKQLEATRQLLAPWLSAVAGGVHKGGGRARLPMHRPRSRGVRTPLQALAEATRSCHAHDRHPLKQAYGEWGDSTPSPSPFLDSPYTPDLPGDCQQQSLTGSQSLGSLESLGSLNHVGSFAQLPDCAPSAEAPMPASPPRSPRPPHGPPSPSHLAPLKLPAGHDPLESDSSAFTYCDPPFGHCPAPGGPYATPIGSPDRHGGPLIASQIPQSPRQDWLQNTRSPYRGAWSCVKGTPGAQDADRGQKRCHEPQPALTVTAADLFSTEELLEGPWPPLEYSQGSHFTSLRDSLFDSPRDFHDPRGLGCERVAWKEGSPQRAAWPESLTSPFRALSARPLAHESP